MERSIQEVAKAAGTTSRTLRHYDAIGLVSPSRVGTNGYRYYDDRALVRLQRVLLLRELGLGLDAIGGVLEVQDRGATTGQRPEAVEAGILSTHLELLQKERARVNAQIAAVGRTIAALSDSLSNQAKGGDLMAQNMFEGFDHTKYKEEVEARWGAEAYASGDKWWRGLGADGQARFNTLVAELNADWIAAAERGEMPDSAAAQDLARRHIEWLTAVPHTPASMPGGDLAGYVTGLGEMYVADERFAANYGGVEGATLVRDALAIYADRELLN